MQGQGPTVAKKQYYPNGRSLNANFRLLQRTTNEARLMSSTKKGDSDLPKNVEVKIPDLN